MTKLLNAPINLIADDEATIRTNLKLLLESEGYQVREAADGGQTERLLQDADVAMCLLDLKMPVLDGLDVLRGHADRLEETPVIVLTAYGGSKAAIEAMKLGVLRLPHQAGSHSTGSVLASGVAFGARCLGA